MSRFLLLLAALIGIGTASPAAAYWEYGHQTVAAIAYRNVTPQVRARIDALLARATLLDTPTCPARTIEEASVWADCIKTLGPRFSYAYSWHYQNIDICKPFDLNPPCRDGNCVSAQIERDVKLLKDRKLPLRERVQALAFLIHFVGDLHQPLHAGDHNDLGGNQVKTSYGIFTSKRLNLHSVWDGYLAERAISTPPSPVRRYSAADRASLSAGSIEEWSRENWEVARDFAYPAAVGSDMCTAPAHPGKLSEAAIETLVPVARQQVVRGGLRLARLLDEALG